MREADCWALLEWAAPRLGLRWPGIAQLRARACKRIRRRVAALELEDLAAYRERLQADAAEWAELERLCLVTISRFHRDAGVWRVLGEQVLPSLAQAALAAGERVLRCWSLGCASGEEPYTLSIVWGAALAARYPELRLRVLATDADPVVLARAARARYAAATLRELPPDWRELAFEPASGEYRLREPYRAPIELRRADVRHELPDEHFHLIICRNVVCTYFTEDLQRTTLERLRARLAPGGALVIGQRERLPAGSQLEPWHADRGIYRSRSSIEPGARNYTRPPAPG